MRFFGLKSCDTCRKALKELGGREVEVIDVRADGVPDADRAAMIAAFGEAVLNKRSTTWRGLSEAERAEPPMTLLTQHPTLMKRPVIEGRGGLTLGWAKDAQSVQLG